MRDKTIFNCYYIDVSLTDRLCFWGFCVGVIMVVALIPKAGDTYPYVIAGLIFMLIPLWFELQIYMIRTRSIIELTDGNEIVVRRWMCRHKSYPADKIESIRVVDFGEGFIGKLTRDCILPMPMGNVNLYPSKGVLVFLNESG